MMDRPNFIVLHADQLRYDCTGAAQRRSGIYTPYIDSIGYQGAHFSACYAACPLCIPQRLSLLSGQSPQRHGIFSNLGIPYLPLETTLPAQMRRSGYLTALIGRTMHTYPSNFSYGFEYYLPGDPSSDRKDTTDAFFCDLRAHTPQTAGGYYGGGAFNNSRAAAPFHLPDDFHQTKWATNRALEFLDARDASRPFLLFLGYYAPHAPHNPPAEFFTRYYQRTGLDGPAISDFDVPPCNSGNTISGYIDLSEEEQRVLRAGYYGNIAFMDCQIGRILEKAVRIPNTYIIFTSDHGELLGDHYLYQKNRPYEGAVHVPLVIMGPGIPDCSTIDAPVAWHDLTSTILDLAGLPIPPSMDGRSMKTLLLQGSDAGWREYLHGECTHTFFAANRTRPADSRRKLYYEAGSQYLTDGKTKYIWHITSGTEQLFDVQNDWNEARDLAREEKYESVLAMWRARLIRELADRPEGYSDGKRLIAGRPPRKLSPRMAALAGQRRSEGLKIAYEYGGAPAKSPDIRQALQLLV